MGDVLVFSGRSSSMLGAVSSLGGSVTAHCVADLMTANFDVILPSSHSVWLDIQPRIGEPSSVGRSDL